MTSRIRKIILKQDPTDATKAQFTVYVENPSEGEDVLAPVSIAKATPEDFSGDLTDFVKTNWPSSDLP